MDDCPFCLIVAGTAPAKIVFEWIEALAIEPLNPVTPGHVLVIPTRHVATFKDDPWVTGRTAMWAAEYAWSKPGDFNMITSAGIAATQTVRHLHFHIVPRHQGDGLALPWTGQAKA